jgi:hypothetical protein
MGGKSAYARIPCFGTAARSKTKFGNIGRHIVLRRSIAHRIVVVPLANNDHGKTQIIAALVRQGERRALQVVSRAARVLTSPWGRTIDALVIPRSYQETLAREFGSIEQALNGVDTSWRQRDLVILPSHLVPADCATIIDLAHGAGLDAIAVATLLDPTEIVQSQPCLALPWDERWTLSNDRAAEPAGQVDALGHDLWTWVAATIERG